MNKIITEIISWQGFSKFNPQSPSKLIRHPEGFFDCKDGKHSALIEAIQRDKIDCVKFLIDCGADINERNALPILYAIQKGDIEIIKLLIEYGADINLVNYFLFEGENAVSFFLKYGINNNFQDEQLFLIFKSKMTCFDFRDNQGNTLLHIATRNKIGNTDNDFHLKVFFEILMVDLIDCNIQNNIGNTVLHHFLYLVQNKKWSNGYFDKFEEIDDNHIQIVLSLIIAGVNWDIKNQEGQTFEDLLFDDEFLDMYFYHETKYRMVNSDPYRNGTPLFLAVFYGQTKKVEWLIKHGADINQLSVYNTFNFGDDYNYALNEREVNEVNGIDFQAKDYIITLKHNQKYTPLMIARKKEIIELLLKYGADPYKRNAIGENSVMVQVQYQYHREGTKHLLLALSNDKYMKGYGYKYKNVFNELINGKNALIINNKSKKEHDKQSFYKLNNVEINAEILQILKQNTTTSLISRILNLFNW